MLRTDIIADAIPDCLKERDQWVCWKYELRAGKKTKVPVHAVFGWNANSSDPATWCSFATALKAYQECDRLAGIAYVFSSDDPYFGIDMDDCLDEQGHLLWGDDLIEVFDSYCEISPSGRGLKLIAKGTKPDFARCKAAWFDHGTIEIYGQKRLFAVTGRQFGEQREITERQQELDALCTQLWFSEPARVSPPKVNHDAPSLSPASQFTNANDRCLQAMLRMDIADHSDGSHRLYSTCCRAVEHDLSDHEAIATLRQHERIKPFLKPWSDVEILQRIRDAEQVCERGFAKSAIARLKPLTYAELAAQYPRLREPVIHGLLREGETLMVIASPKTGKSWLATDLAITLSTGRALFDTFETEPGDVLIIDNELHPNTIKERLDKVSLARGVAAPEMAGVVKVQSLRGRLTDLNGMQAYFDQFRPGQFKVVILDALYRMLPPGTDENNNAQMAQVFNTIDCYAEQLQTSFVCVHHSSKGSQSNKSVTDVGAGAGAMSRATDSHMILLAHAEPACVVMEAAVRSWPPIEPSVLRWSFPIWTPDDSLDPADLKVIRPSKREHSGDTEESQSRQCRWTVEKFVETFITEFSQPYADVLDAGEDAGLTERMVKRFLRSAVRRKLIFKWAPGGNQPTEYATIPISKPVTKTDRIQRLLLKEPELTNREAGVRTGSSHTLVSKVRQQLKRNGNRPRTRAETA